ncbi:hypothetical protein NESM_000164500 [Novymonas esmeraldas]|uniref:Hsp33 family protein n=1 Tax=Novymonas esmeraldas TaxID=1808958 RepID=A0AAW0F4C1_9TRYP
MRLPVLLRGAAKAAPPAAVVAPTGTSRSSSTSSASCHGTLHAFRTRDITLRVPSKDHLLRVSFCSTRHLLAETIRRHDLLHSTGAHLSFLQLLGTQLTFANLLASAQEGEERVEVRFTAEEATILTEALALGECRCYLRPEYNAQLVEQGLPPFPLRVNRVLYRQERPFSSLVHADLAEVLRPPPDTTHSATTRDGAGESGEVPFSLCTPGMAERVPLEAWRSFFAYNTTIHAYNYLRRSDASVPAVWMHTSVNSRALRDAGLLAANGTDAHTAQRRLQPKGCAGGDTATVAGAEEEEALRRALPLSFGVVVTPLAAGAAVDRRVGHLNRALSEAAALLCAPRVGGGALAASPLLPLLEKCADTHTTCQHVLSLVSGDHDGAYQAAVAARQYSDDPATVAAVVQPIRRALGVEDLVIPLEAEEQVRTGLDFFCRCSKQSILDSLVSAPSSALVSLRDAGGEVHCSFCGRTHCLTDGDWHTLETARPAPSPPS